ncbi:ATP-binding protein [Modestobacter sp. DSM 44400]|uniref:ATP-binding protein n=1 Tax=Modestobacter sp. DSM 44400 TaxID=1550230 RepID=UPI001587EF0A|nr:ATP-binding protein [Modestobacter sp. DSM 44400]
MGSATGLRRPSRRRLSGKDAGRRWIAGPRRWPLRVRLTAAFTAAMTLLMIGVAVATVTRFGDALDEAVDASVNSQLQVLQAAGDPRTADLGALPSNAHQVIAPDGSLTPGSIPPDGSLLTTTELAQARRGPWRAERGSVPGLSGPARLAAVPLSSGGGVAVVAVSLTSHNASLADLRTELATTFPLILSVAAAGAYLLTAAALRPVERMRAHAAAVTSDGRLDPLPVPPGNDEIARLGHTLNGMLTRLHDALHRERQFIADASHELRTPLSLLTTELELVTARPRSAGELSEALHSALEETHRLTRLAEDLLLLARIDSTRGRADGGRLPALALREPILLQPLLHSLAARFTPTATTTPVTVQCPADLAVYADPDDLDRALSNLLHNALRHGRPPVTITALAGRPSVQEFTTSAAEPLRSESAAADPGNRSAAIIEVTDCGPGFDPAFLSHAFERFTRADTARTGGSDAGAGLGLAITASLLSGNDGSITAGNRPTGGAAFTLTLPGAHLPSHPAHPDSAVTRSQIPPA